MTPKTKSILKAALLVLSGALSQFIMNRQKLLSTTKKATSGKDFEAGTVGSEGQISRKPKRGAKNKLLN